MLAFSVHFKIKSEYVYVLKFFPLKKQSWSCKNFICQIQGVIIKKK